MSRARGQRPARRKGICARVSGCDVLQNREEFISYGALWMGNEARSQRAWYSRSLDLTRAQ